MKPHIFQRIAKQVWETELSKELLQKYPQLFSKVTKTTKVDAELPLPPLSLQIKGGWRTLKSKEFAQSLLFTHDFIASKWKDFVFLLENPSQLHTKDKRLINLAKSKKQAKEKDWLHKKYNYTVGVVQWHNGNLIFFIDPTVDVAGGVQSTNIHSVRESRELSDLEKAERETFRTNLTKSLLATNSKLKLGKEGRYLLSKK